MTALRYMTPRLSVDDFPKGAERNSESFRQLSVFQAARPQSANIADIGFGELRAPICFPAIVHQADFHGVMHVLHLRAPLQILRTIVRFVTVNVIGNMSVTGRRAAECLKNKPVNDAHCASPIPGEANHLIAPDFQVLRNDSQARPPHPAMSPDVLANNRPNATVVRYFLRFLKACHGLPNFCFHLSFLGFFAPNVNPIRS